MNKEPLELPVLVPGESGVLASGLSSVVIDSRLPNIQVIPVQVLVDVA
jgi:hypothetical protein